APDRVTFAPEIAAPAESVTWPWIAPVVACPLSDFSSLPGSEAILGSAATACRGCSATVRMIARWALRMCFISLEPTHVGCNLRTCGPDLASAASGYQLQ